MTETDKKLVKDFALGKLTEVEFLESFSEDLNQPSNYIFKALEYSLNAKDRSYLDHVFLLGFKLSHFEFDGQFVDMLNALLIEEWHYKHEDIARLLQKLRSPKSVGSLYQAANTYYDYLEYNDCEALIVKCAYALGDINTKEAREKLRLMSESENKIIQGEGRRFSRLEKDFDSINRDIFLQMGVMFFTSMTHSLTYFSTAIPDKPI